MTISKFSPDSRFSAGASTEQGLSSPHAKPTRWPLPLRHILLLLNPNASRRTSLTSESLSGLRDGGFDVTVKETVNAREMDFIIRHSSADAVAIGGGDGTINAALPAVLDTGLPLGIVPLGTANDLSRTLEIPTDPVDALALIAGGRVRYIDVGWAKQKPFLNAAGMGIGSRMSRSLSAERKASLGRLGYLTTVLEVYRHQRPFSAIVECASESLRFRAVQVTVGNGVFYGGGALVSDAKAIDDGLLTVFGVRPGRWWRMLLVGLAMRLGKQTALEAVVSRQGERFRVLTSRPLELSLDGEPSGIWTPATFTIAKRVLPVFTAGGAEP